MVELCWILLFNAEYEESLQKKATAAGFDRPIDYVRHKREKNPRYCRISYEKYKKVKLCLYWELVDICSCAIIIVFLLFKIENEKYGMCSSR